jgi:MarR family 2-MHQ and catechol resistance regulon transcriptional repressor
VRLTEAGRAKIEAVLPHHVAVIVQEMSVLTPEEQESLGRLLKKLGKGSRKAG